VVTEYNLTKIIGDIEVYIDFKMLKVKVPIIFSGTQGWTLYYMISIKEATFNIQIHLPDALYL
jgi:hypothetical protein